MGVRHHRADHSVVSLANNFDGVEKFFRPVIQNRRDVSRREASMRYLSQMLAITDCAKLATRLVNARRQGRAGARSFDSP